MLNAIRFAAYEHEFEAMFTEHGYFECVYNKASDGQLSRGAARE